jgi:hypothetical protein
MMADRTGTSAATSCAEWATAIQERGQVMTMDVANVDEVSTHTAVGMSGPSANQAAGNVNTCPIRQSPAPRKSRCQSAAARNSSNL